MASVMNSSRRKGLTKARGKRKQARAGETQAAQRRAAERRQTSLRAYRTKRALGWSLVTIGVLVGVSHWLEHLQVFTIAPKGVEDLLLGYPMAQLLGIAGSIVLSRA